jgi:negative regulator of flagellin synthesis FlgM
MRMEIRNNAESLKTLLGVPSTAAAQPQQIRNGTAAAQGAFAGDRATLSSAASEVAQGAQDSGVRTDKVAAVQAAVQAGTYNVPASAVAGKLVDAMLAGGE